MIPQKMSVPDQELVYDAIAEAIDGAPEHQRAMLLAKLAFTLANLVGDREQVERAIEAAKRDLR